MKYNYNNSNFPVMVIKFTKKMIKKLEEEKSHRFFYDKRSAYKLCLLGTEIYFSPNHWIYEDVKFINSLFLRRQWNSNSTFLRILSFFVEQTHNNYIKLINVSENTPKLNMDLGRITYDYKIDEDEDSWGQGHTFVSARYKVLPFNKALEYYRLIGEKKYDAADYFIKTHQSRRMEDIVMAEITSKGLNQLSKFKDYKILFEDKNKYFETKNINIIKVPKILVNKKTNKVITSKQDSKVALKQVKESIKTNSNNDICSVDLKDILLQYKLSNYNDIDRKIDALQQLNHFEKSNLKLSKYNIFDYFKYIHYTGENKSSKHYDKYNFYRARNKIKERMAIINDIDRILKVVKDNKLYNIVDNKNGREFNFFTSVKKEVRSLVLESLGYNIQIDLKAGEFQLLIEDEKKYIGTNAIEIAYKYRDKLIEDFIKEDKEFREAKNGRNSKIKSSVKSYLIRCLNGGSYEYYPDDWNIELKSVKNILTLGEKLNFVSKKLYERVKKTPEFKKMQNDVKKESNGTKRVTEDNFIYYWYIRYEEKAINYIVDKLKLDKYIRIHDAVIFTGNPKKIKKRLKNFKYNFSVDRVKSPLHQLIREITENKNTNENTSKNVDKKYKQTCRNIDDNEYLLGRLDYNVVKKLRDKLIKSLFNIKEPSKELYNKYLYKK